MVEKLGRPVVIVVVIEKYEQLKSVEGERLKAGGRRAKDTDLGR